MSIILKYMTPKVAKMMLADLDFEVAENTDNESLRDSIKLVSKYLNEKE